jgi:signal transduction histidine kinase
MNHAGHDPLWARIERLRRRTRELRAAHRALLGQPYDRNAHVRHRQALQEHRAELAATNELLRGTRHSQDELVGLILSGILTGPADDAPDDPPDDLARSSLLTVLSTVSMWMAHEIRQPLTSIGLSAMACLRVLDQASPDLALTRDALRDVVADVRKAEDVVRRTRELFQTRVVSKTSFDLNAMLAEVFATVDARVDHARIGLVTALAPELPRAHGDPVLLKQVVVNLMTNAIQSVEAANRTVRRIDVASRVLPEGEVGVSVSDTGTGLSGADTERLFAVPYTTKKTGIGIGLWLSRIIVEAHRGHIWADERADGGATFSFVVPAGLPSVEDASLMPAAV